MSTNLTLSGNEITDAVRAAALEGDGLAPCSATGIWESTINAFPNGGFETNAAFCLGRGSATIARATSQAKYGAASLELDTPGAGVNEGFSIFANSAGTTRLAATAALPYTLSGWVYCAAGATLACRIDWYTATSGGSYISTITGTETVIPAGVWTRISVTGTAPGTTGGAVPHIVTRVSAQDIVFYADGVQWEQQPLATPYVETNGGTAARASSRVQVPVSYLDETQGWVAVRLRYPWGTANEPNGGAAADYLFAWRDDLNNRIVLYYNEADDKVKFLRVAAGAGVTRAPAQTAPSAGYQDTVIAKWTATTTGLSLAGSAFDSGADANVPTLAATTFDIGTQLGSSWIDADIFWFACGTGTLTDADAAAIHALGNSDRYPSAFPGSCTLVWPGLISLGLTAGDAQSPESPPTLAYTGF